MSMVLWANILVNGVVESDEADKYALYKHAKKIDELTKILQVASFMSIHDCTDMEFNISEQELPDGMESTDELMAINGLWIDGSDAVDMLERLIDDISNNSIKFGMLSNDKDIIVDELKESLVFAKKAKELDGKFNFSVVM
ncbi:hypothetical protein [Pleionea litopenaei]|uniref:Uncharacterized protein n=1 Tax=Pleionea litopenaei TaxID=3070815 RepID=A0AA51RWA1_9GAMM|nr:hypothetical protein [Pleionea sp. HL-JVS1]WMS88752.1 hypothetical protein Q9312_07495 [Pleionea sp. HL-JVS1]